MRDLLLKEKNGNRMLDVASYFNWLDKNKEYRENKDEENKKNNIDRINEINYINKELNELKKDININDNKTDKIKIELNDTQKDLIRSKDLNNKIEVNHIDITQQFDEYLKNTNNELLELKKEGQDINKDIIINKTDIKEMKERMEDLIKLMEYKNKKN